MIENFQKNNSRNHLNKENITILCKLKLNFIIINYSSTSMKHPSLVALMFE